MGGLLFLMYPSICTKTADLLKPCNRVMTGWDSVTNTPVWVEYVARDYYLECQGATFAMMRVAAAIMLVTVPIGFPLVILVCFYWKNKNNQLWIRASSHQEGATYDNRYNAHFVPDPWMKANCGFLFLTYEPHMWWWEVKELVKKFIFCTVLLMLGPGGGATSPEQ